MRRSLFTLAACLVAQAITAEFSPAQQPQYIDQQVTVRRPVTEVRNEIRNETVYETRYTTRIHEYSQPVFVPVTQTEWRPRWHGVLNPFVPAHVAWHPVNVTRWELRSGKVQIPTTRREIVAQTRAVQEPVRHLGFVEQTQTQRVAVYPAPSGGPVNVAQRPEVIGGVGQIQSDPPRHGIRIPEAARGTQLR